jgi:hypothetical protein
MIKLCKSNFQKNPQCESAAETYAYGTMLFGQAGFEESQNNNCICLPIADDSIINHYKQILINFYEKHAPGKNVDIDKLIAKYSVNSGSEVAPVYKLHKLYYELMKKYDDSIKHVDGRVGKEIARPTNPKLDL